MPKYQRDSKKVWHTPTLCLVTVSKDGKLKEITIPEDASASLNKTTRTPANTVLFPFAKSGHVSIGNKLARRDASILLKWFQSSGMPAHAVIGLKYPDGFACAFSVADILAICEMVIKADAILRVAETQVSDLGKSGGIIPAYRAADLTDPDDTDEETGAPVAAFDWSTLVK